MTYDYSIMVLPADKGRASVVMDVSQHLPRKDVFLIENGPYQLLNKDPTDRLSRKLAEKLLTVKQSGHLTRPFTTKSDLGTNSRLESTVYRRS